MKDEMKSATGGVLRKAMERIEPPDGLKGRALKAMLAAAQAKKARRKRTLRMMRIAVPAVAVVIAAAVLLSTVAGGRLALSASAQNLMSGVKKQSAQQTKVSQAFVDAAADFSVKLFRETAVEGKNSLISPLSVYYTLGLASNGARGATRQALLNAIGGGKLTQAQLNDSFEGYMSQIASVGHGTTLSLANSIWYRSEFTADQSFLQQNADFFGAGAYKTDFSKPSAAKAVNEWVKEHTNGLIDRIVDDKIDPDVQMMLVNALYFNATWESVFYARDNKSLDFHPAQGAAYTTTFMTNSFMNSYIEDDGAQGVLMPYSDGRFALAVLLPKNGASPASYLKTLTGAGFVKMVKAPLTGTMASIELPKFTVKTDTMQLQDALKNMGLGIAFDPDKADFSGMGHDAANENLFIGKVRHKAYIRVDERGTEAGAATEADVTGSSAPLVKMVKLTFDRPFVYAIVDMKTGLPLFMGTMERP
ncbi:MAG: serpin family protein [Clostridia bacterium]|nr:serpin family protein [Clostridia bacterium]